MTQIINALDAELLFPFCGKNLRYEIMHK